MSRPFWIHRLAVATTFTPLQFCEETTGDPKSRVKDTYPLLSPFGINHGTTPPTISQKIVIITGGRTVAIAAILDRMCVMTN